MLRSSLPLCTSVAQCLLSLLHLGLRGLILLLCLLCCLSQSLLRLVHGLLRKLLSLRGILVSLGRSLSGPRFHPGRIGYRQNLDHIICTGSNLWWRRGPEIGIAIAVRVAGGKELSSLRKRNRLHVLECRRGLRREIRKTGLRQRNRRQTAAWRRLRGDSAIGLQRCLRGTCGRRRSGDRCSHRADSSGCPRCAPSARHAYQNCFYTHHGDIRRTDADELIGDTRLRHEADKNSRRAKNEGSAHVRHDSGDHGAGMHIADSRGRQEIDQYLRKTQDDDTTVGRLTGDGAGRHSHRLLKSFHGLANGLPGCLLRLL